MSLFDFFFPEQAQAEYLRQIADSSTLARTQARIAQVRGERSKLSSDKHVKELENEIAQHTIILEAVLEIFGENGSLTRSDLARKVAEIDARDGSVDGRITDPKKSEEPGSKPKFNFPE